MKRDISVENLYTIEKSILAIALNSPNALPDIFNGLVFNDFLDPSHKTIFEMLTILNKESKEITINSVVALLDKEGKLEQVGGATKIQSIALEFFTDEGIENYIETVFFASASRKFDATLKIIQNERNNGQLDVEDAMNKIQRELISIDLNQNKSDVKHFKESADSLIEKIKDLQKRNDTLTGVPTGLFELDDITSGWQKGDLIILAARPSMGKTAFSLHLAYRAAKENQGVAIFSLEMPAEQLTQRLLTMVSHLDSKKLRTGKNISDQEWKTLMYSKENISKLPIYIDDTPGITVQQIQSKLYKLKRDHDIKFCVIDYLQLIGSNNLNIDRQNEISNISRHLKRISRELEIPIVCLSQLSRSVEKREDKKPIMSDLRDSGAIEQDADLIMFLYREDYYTYTKDENNNHVPNNEPSAISPTDVIIAKHRNGATGVVKVSFDKRHGKFLDKG
ncbi:replicative DNA helicase [Mesoplasma corruscae]|uniref:Replicative DNA helicase n=1 Tax=Mesoplasma corruscae TaxID=216874 RepID=A0A2S5RHI9_9MOLU|nr:replicative DNA helicase [Mesoplasma corruscae]PPE06595.1 replicative DNA helicase [Mesoplasma corruscae]